MPAEADKKLPPRRPRPNPLADASTVWTILILGTLVVVAAYWWQGRNDRSEISYGFFRHELEDDKNVVQGQHRGGEGSLASSRRPPSIPTANKDSDGAYPKLQEEVRHGPAAHGPGRSESGPGVARAAEGRATRRTEPADNTVWLLMFYMLVPVGLLVGLWFLFGKFRESFFAGGLTGGFAKSGARRYEGGTAADHVRGRGRPGRRQARLAGSRRVPPQSGQVPAARGRVPKGVLLMGPPGTGKTLLGRAVAGEAGVPFYSINGSEFIQMFVGVGAGRVRDLFNTAKEHAPAILFIDEIDAVGRHRGTGVGGGHDEREQTLNQILSEMDGFTQNESVIVMAATNRPDVLDPALLRPGRFDRHITVDRPSYKGRLAIFQVHSKDVPLDFDVDLERLAAGTVGLTGADIRNLVNEAALWASRHDKDYVDMADFEYARDKLLMGSKREEVLSDQEKAMTAYHESGHALLAWLVPGVGPPAQGVDRSPRPLAGGHATAARGRPREHQRKRTAHAAAVPAGRPGGREAGLRPVQRRRRGRPEQGHAAWPAAW